MKFPKDDFEALAKAHPHLIASDLLPSLRGEQADLLGVKVPNFSAAIRGQRPFPKNKYKLYLDLLGLDDNNALLLGRVHAWRVLNNDNDIHGSELLREALNRFGFKPFQIGPKIYSESRADEPVVFVVGARGQCVLVQLFKLKDPRYPLMPFEITPTSFPGGSWMPTVSWDKACNEEVSDSSCQMEPIVVPDKLFKRLMEGRCEPGEVYSLLETPPAIEWTWQRVAHEAAEVGVTPGEAAKALGLLR